jgi:glutathione synthase/RimK-type ligase-like ATP-grasp enzyme
VDLFKAKNPIPNSPQKNSRTIQPDFLLIRNLCYGVANADYRNILYGFAHANIPSINSIESLIMCLQRPVVFGALHAIQKQLGQEKFPLIEQSFYSGFTPMKVAPSCTYPVVVKVSYPHAGYGKIKINDYHAFDDLRSVVAIHDDYCTTESYKDGAYDLRIQKIGPHYRCFKRVGASQWKTNMGAALLEEIPLTTEYKRWVDEVAKQFNGMEIFSVDAIHTTKGETYILEVNDSSIGLAPAFEEQDMGYMRELVLERMQGLFVKDHQKSIETEETDDIQVQLLNAKSEIDELKGKFKKTQKNGNNSVLYGIIALLLGMIIFQYVIK